MHNLKCIKISYNISCLYMSKCASGCRCPQAAGLHGEGREFDSASKVAKQRRGTSSCSINQIQYEGHLPSQWDGKLRSVGQHTGKQIAVWTCSVSLLGRCEQRQQVRVGDWEASQPAGQVGDFGKVRRGLRKLWEHQIHHMWWTRLSLVASWVASGTNDFSPERPVVRTSLLEAATAGRSSNDMHPISVANSASQGREHPLHPRHRDAVQVHVNSV